MPPYTWFEQTRLSPFSHRARMVNRVAACPEEVHMAAAPPSSSAILASTAITVGLAKRL